MPPKKTKKVTAPPEIPAQAPRPTPIAPKIPATKAPPKISEISTPEIKPIPKPKPLVEGINSPVLTPVETSQKAEKLTSAEESLIRNLDIHINREQPAHIPVKTQSPKITLMSGEGRPKKRNWGLRLILIILILGVLGFSYYIWRLYGTPNKIQYNNPASTTTNNVNNLSTASGTSANQNSQATSTINPNEVGKDTNDLFTPPMPIKQLIIKNTPTGYLNVREQPTTSSKIITKVNPGQFFAYTETKNGWYKITLSDTSSGWVIGTYITVQK